MKYSLLIFIGNKGHIEIKVKVVKKKVKILKNI